ncbi:acylamino-acid-releasing enzyme isoform X1 [Strongylocentrotus purpuratus]|uniref:Prolyl endopeptidase n=1 Tax=Strongylocentrotus purpuratus TaxID=7668 RepID=A0A7M7MY80_STRPU|nr:acylamino-acid-releasing enzyme isoform X1 [Strongylocentrotus purpuratus]
MDFPSVERAVKVYRECASAPSLSSASLQKTGDSVFSVHSTWSQRDLERECNIKYRQTHIVTLDSNGQIGDVIDPGTNTELNSEQLVRWSPSGKLKAVLRKIKDKKGDEKQYLEVWNNIAKIHNINLTALDKHGKVYEDGEFGCLEWSSCESQLLYVAEKKQPKAVSYFDKSKEGGSEENPETDAKKKDPEVKGDQFVHRQDWGELLVGKHSPVPCILNLQTGQVTIPEGLPNDVSVGQAIWTPDDSGIVFTGWENEPYRLGLIYCRNRRSAIYHLDLSSQTCNTISITGQSVRSPVFSPDASKLIYIQNSCHGPHMQCAQLIVYHWESKETKVTVDIVQRPTEGRPFPGLYVGRFEQQCWLDNETILVSTAWRSSQTIIAINICTGEVTRLTNGPDFGSWMFCDIKQRLILACRSSPTRSAQLVVGVIPQEGDISCINWKPLHESSVILSDVIWSVITLKPKTEQGSDIDFETIILKPKANSGSQEKKLPLIVWAHGGPHSVFSTGYLLLPGLFCQLGFVIACVNYRGSIGFGQASIDSLPGFVGTHDVKDVQAAAEAVIEQGLVDRERVAVSGGSHGGFLSTHMIGQYPDFYKACITRNPVTNLAAMLGGTDIPSWTMTEAGMDFDFKIAPSAEMYAKMFNCSPMAHIDKVRAPTLLMLGSDDLRVPPQQGIRYHEMLKARGVKTRLLMYPDNSHPINKVDAEADCFMNMYTWITEHL